MRLRLNTNLKIGSKLFPKGVYDKAPAELEKEFENGVSYLLKLPNVGAAEVSKPVNVTSAAKDKAKADKAAKARAAKAAKAKAAKEKKKKE